MHTVWLLRCLHNKQGSESASCVDRCSCQRVSRLGGWSLLRSSPSPCAAAGAAAAPMSNNTRSCAGRAIVLSFCSSCRLGCGGSANGHVMQQLRGQCWCSNAPALHKRLIASSNRPASSPQFEARWSGLTDSTLPAACSQGGNNYVNEPKCDAVVVGGPACLMPGLGRDWWLLLSPEPLSVSCHKGPLLSRICTLRTKCLLPLLPPVQDPASFCWRSGKHPHSLGPELPVPGFWTAVPDL